MVKLDPSHELRGEPELPELMSPHHPVWWPWLLALVISSIATFSLTLALLAVGTSAIFVSIVAIVTFAITVFLSHSVAEHAK